MPPRFRRYVALGDSISIDAYPGDDYRARLGLGHPVPGLGAASLLFRNQDAPWPEFRGRDLTCLFPGITFECPAADGATTASVLEEQLPPLGKSAEPTVVTLTAGGNDILAALGADEQRGAHLVEEALRRLEHVLGTLARVFPAGLVLLGTVYDPSDGSGRLEHVKLLPHELAWLARFNQGVRALCAGQVRLVDIHHRFLGHGLGVPPAERWYWSRSSIEPGFLGASELRRLWLEALGVA